MKRRTTRNPATPIVVEHGTGWTICWDPSSKDFSVYIEVEFISAHPTQQAARSAANEYTYQQLKRAA